MQTSNDQNFSQCDFYLQEIINLNLLFEKEIKGEQEPELKEKNINKLY